MECVPAAGAVVLNAQHDRTLARRGGRPSIGCILVMVAEKHVVPSPSSSIRGLMAHRALMAHTFPAPKPNYEDS
jgi:hypothetical protein